MSNPFSVGLFETDSWPEALALGSAVAHIVCTMLVLRASSGSWVTAKLRVKETPNMAASLFAAYVVGFVHAVVVSVAALLVVVYERYEIWPPTIAFSIGYFVSDFYFYAVPTKQYLIMVHHIVMIVGHYPCMELAAATLYGAGDPKLIMWLSAVGYLTEISNVFLDIRWFQLKVVPGKPSQLLYALNSALLLVSYIGSRILLMPGVAWRDLLPRYGAYKAMDQLSAFYVIVGGVGFITLISVGYTFILLKPGLMGFLFYGHGKKADKAQ